MSVMAVATVVYQVFPMSIIRVFGSESKLYNQFAMLSFRIFLLASILDGFHICTGIYFQAIGKPAYATIISITRQVLFIIPISIIFAALFGVEGVLWAGPVSDTLAFIIAFILMFRELKLLNKRADVSVEQEAENE
jgi:Na+-driven multidrug efflux pump